MGGLATHVQSLPKELYDEIYNLVFTAKSNDRVNITPSYRPPAMLQVDSLSRSKFATSYYGMGKCNSGSWFVVDDKHTMCMWLRSLKKEHILLIGEIVFHPHWMYESYKAPFSSSDVEDEIFAKIAEAQRFFEQANGFDPDDNDDDDDNDSECGSDWPDMDDRDYIGECDEESGEM